MLTGLIWRLSLLLIFHFLVGPPFAASSPTCNKWQQCPIMSTPSTNASECKLPAVSGVSLSVGHNYNLTSGCASTTGTLSGYMIFVDFPDQPFGDDSTQSLYEFFLPEAADWFHIASYGKLSFEVMPDTKQFYRMPNNTDTYEFQRGISYDKHLKYINDAIGQWESNSRSFAFPVDVLYVVASRNSPAISFSPAFLGEVYSPTSGQLIARKAVTVGQDAYRAWGYKLLNHETGHAMCLPDLYPAEGPTGLYVGGWDIMGLISGPSPDYFAWNKWRQGWIEDDQIMCVLDKGWHEIEIMPLEETANTGYKAVVVKADETQALVAEVRSNKGVNGQTCVSGVLLYTIDTTIATAKGPVKVIDTNPDTTGCNGEPLNDAPLSKVGSYFYVPGWNMSVLVSTHSETTGSWTIGMVRW